ncbi:hypothetical protein DENSPDRAFT_849989 [Dentipellis sp. KUC8613]|nr:hypothetical protein DENSPDRAFT_849989 [Dentipellis sp. KUC8613]
MSSKCRPIGEGLGTETPPACKHYLFARAKGGGREKKGIACVREHEAKSVGEARSAEISPAHCASICSSGQDICICPLVLHTPSVVNINNELVIAVERGHDIESADRQLEAVNRLRGFASQTPSSIAITAASAFGLWFSTRTIVEASWRGRAGTAKSRQWLRNEQWIAVLHEIEFTYAARESRARLYNV